MYNKIMIMVIGVLMLLLVGLVNNEVSANDFGENVRYDIKVSDAPVMDKKMEFLRTSNYWLFEMIDNGMSSKNVILEYYDFLNIEIGKDISSNLMFKNVKLENIKPNDLVMFLSDQIKYSIYVGDGYHVYNVGEKVVMEKLDSRSIISILRSTEEINEDLFIKSTAIIETGDRPISNKLYYGRYQIAKEYLPYYLKRLGVKVTKTPSEKIQRSVVSLILKDSVKYLVKNKLPVNTYSIRVVYNLGRKNTYRFRNYKLSMNLLKSNLPSKIEKTHENFQEYWSYKVTSVLAKLS